jgi:demethylmenaquinone methyltransferase/2-methoxy-6-polyprenyl-1,4-benzoquinol methylase
MNDDKHSTHFGYQSVAWDEKQSKVGEVFHSVAKNYDIMNDLMSLGVHRLWKHFTIELSQIRPNSCVLDLAGGSGDLTKLICKKVGDLGQVVLADINSSMLGVGRNRLIDSGFYKNVSFIQANAELLPFADNTFHCLTMAFGLRNVTDKLKALKSMLNVIKPGGKIMILEFSTPQNLGLKSIYDWYSFNILPKIGSLVAKDESSYKYLAESIRMHPDQNSLKSLIEEAGFEDCRYYNLSGGIVALHIAYKY